MAHSRGSESFLTVRTVSVWLKAMMKKGLLNWACCCYIYEERGIRALHNKPAEAHGYRPYLESL
jgi:hypothetical protein